MAKLTKKEQAWLDEVQAVLTRCPSARIGFYTIGDRDVFLWNTEKADAVNMHRCDFYEAVRKEQADFKASLVFPNNVESTAG